MYFALGLLVASLVALAVLPAVWRRAVRLTKKRIEAATPITMAEFRADKDQLRAEFALSTRRLEMTIETLRQRLAEQVSAASQQSTDLGALRIEREKHAAIVEELEAREAALRAHALDLEKQATDLAQRLRMRERELETRAAEIAALRPAPPPAPPPDDAPPSGEYEAAIASAEHRLNALLAETGQAAEEGEGQPEQLLAEKLGLEDALHALRKEVAAVETTILADWDSKKRQEAPLRHQLNDIAAAVSRLVYAVEHEPQAGTQAEESLFERVQRFADDGEGEELLPAPTNRQHGAVAERLATLRELQER